MMRLAALRRRHDDSGYTLVELLVSMGVFAMLLGLIATATSMMVRDLTAQTGQTDNLDSSRKVVNLLDKQVRYANAINSPGTGTDGALYVEWRSGNSGQTQSCTQWRWAPATNLLQYRAWKLPFSGPAPSWVTQSDGIYQSGAAPVFSISNVLPNPAPSGVTQRREALTVSFAVKNGNPKKTSVTEVRLTAQNTTGPNPPGTPVCQSAGISRP